MLTYIKAVSNMHLIISVNLIKSAAFSIYPNPCTAKRLYVEDKGSRLKQLLITDMAGWKVLVQHINSAATLHSINVEALKSGVYFVGLYSNGVGEVRLVVK